MYGTIGAVKGDTRGLDYSSCRDMSDYCNSLEV